jgi:hypothetical protein
MIHQYVEEKRETQIDQHPRHQPEIRILIQILLIHLREPQVEEVNDTQENENCLYAYVEGIGLKQKVIEVLER